VPAALTPTRGVLAAVLPQPEHGVRFTTPAAAELRRLHSNEDSGAVDRIASMRSEDRDAWGRPYPVARARGKLAGLPAAREIGTYLGAGNVVAA
jgi:hypothetical protein